MYSKCVTPGCHNAPRSADARLCRSCLERNAAAKLEYNRERQRNKPHSDATRKRPGCDNVHHGRSPYCIEHVKRPRGANANLPRTGTLDAARELLRADDLPQRLRRVELVRRWNIVTGRVEEVWE